MGHKKSLSQFFLTNRKYLNRITDSLDTDKAEFILEIGGGRGSLTEGLLEKGLPVVCVEIDDKLCGVIKEKFNACPDFKVVCGDIRNFKVEGGKVLVAGNVPYHISFDIIEFLANNRDRITSVYLTLQKEFAGKISASPGSKAYCFLSCFTRLYFKTDILFNIPKSCFIPSPKVDSSLVRFIPDYSLEIEDGRKPEFISFLRKVFTFRRKKISNILKKVFPKIKDIDSLLKSCGISPDLRPENIPLPSFLCMMSRPDAETALKIPQKKFP